MADQGRLRLEYLLSRHDEPYCALMLPTTGSRARYFIGQYAFVQQTISGKEVSH